MLHAFLTLSLFMFLSSKAHGAIDVTIKIKEAFSLEEACERLELGKNVNLIEPLHTITAKVRNEQLSEIDQSDYVQGMDYSKRCSMIVPDMPAADNEALHRRYGRLWGKLRIFYKIYPFEDDGSMPRKKPPEVANNITQNEGHGVEIFVMDTGILPTHKIFEDSCLDEHPWSAYGDDGVDHVGHGTHVAGILCSKMYGLASRARLHSIKVLDDSGYGSEEAILRGIEAALLRKQQYAYSPVVVNMSMASHASSSVDAAVEKLIDAGITVVAAAGNEKRDASACSPARMPKVITVGACVKSPNKIPANRGAEAQKKDVRAHLSNFGPCVQFYAPGCYIFSADSQHDESYSYKTGTSMAAPYACGLAACILSAYPHITPNQVLNFMMRHCSVTNQVDLGVPRQRQAGTLLYASAETLSEFPNNLQTFKAQSTEDYYGNCFKSIDSFGGFDSIIRFSLSLKDIQNEGLSSTTETQTEDVINSPNSQSDRIAHTTETQPEGIISYIQKEGIVNASETKIIFSRTPTANELLKLNLKPNEFCEGAFYACFLEEEVSPGHWVRNENMLLTQYLYETYLELDFDKDLEKHYRMVVEVYSGQLNYSFNGQVLRLCAPPLLESSQSAAF